MTDEPEEVPPLATAILAALADQLDIVVNQARAALAGGAPETTVDITRKLARAAEAGVEQGHWPRTESWLAVFAATAVQRLAHVEE
jgi:hypothetical protein